MVATPTHNEEEVGSEKQAVSALGHKRTYALQNGMSALPPIATVKEDFSQEVMSALPLKADMCGALANVYYGPKPDSCTEGALFDHLVGATEQGWRYGKAKYLGSLQVDHQLEFGGLLNREVGRLCPTFNLTNRGLIIALAARYGVPVISNNPVFAESGGLITYGVDFTELFRQAAGYVDRILKGDSPTSLPVQNPTKFDLVVNLKTAKALGLTVPPMLLSRADAVIE